MKISGGLSEKGVVIGNTYDKYASTNPIVRKIMRGFDDNLSALVDFCGPDTIHEVGCGEGYWVMRWAELGLDVRGSDFSKDVIEIAKKNAIEKSLTDVQFKKKSIYNLVLPEDSADLIVCCEVLEHLERPKEALQVLSGIAKRFAIFSVPREPLWSILNMARGKYLGDMGNTPGHIQRWSRGKFLKMVANYFTVVEIRTPIPWTMLLCKPKPTQAG